MELAAGGEPQIDRVAQAFQIDAGPAVDPAQERDRRVGLRPAVMRGEVVEPGLDVAPGDGVEGTAKPVAEMELDQLSIAFIGPHRPVWIGRYVFLGGFAEDGDAARLGAFVRRIAAAGDLAQDLMRHAPGALGRQPVAASEDDALVGGLPATVACAVVDDEGLVARRIDANAETGQPVVPSNPGFVCGLKGVDGSFGQRGFDQSEAFSGGMVHGWIMGHGAREGNTVEQHRKFNSSALQSSPDYEAGDRIPINLLFYRTYDISSALLSSLDVVELGLQTTW